jgi:hypothetical protein
MHIKENAGTVVDGLFAEDAGPSRTPMPSLEGKMISLVMILNALFMISLRGSVTGVRLFASYHRLLAPISLKRYFLIDCDGNIVLLTVRGKPAPGEEV